MARSAHHGVTLTTAAVAWALAWQGTTGAIVVRVDWNGLARSCQSPLKLTATDLEEFARLLDDRHGPTRA